MPFWAFKREGFFRCRKYTPLYEKCIKESENKSMETTIVLDGWIESGLWVGLSNKMLDISARKEGRRIE